MRQLWRIAAVTLFLTGSAAMAQTAHDEHNESAQPQVRDPAAGADPRGKPLGESTILREKEAGSSHAAASNARPSGQQGASEAGGSQHETGMVQRQ